MFSASGIEFGTYPFVIPKHFVCREYHKLKCAAHNHAYFRTLKTYALAKTAERLLQFSMLPTLFLQRISEIANYRDERRSYVT